MSGSGEETPINLTLHIWRQERPELEGKFETFRLADVSPEMSFLEMLDVLNENLIQQKKDPVAFDHDCREGICGMCNLVINGQPHGPDAETTTCQLHMRRFKDGDSLYIEPPRAKGFPIVKDLVVDRGAFDRIMIAGGFISVRAGSPPDANAIPIQKEASDEAMDAAACIGCGACVAACPNAAAMLFVSAKVAHLGLLPQGAPERQSRAAAMVKAMDDEGFGNCTNHFECETACPKGISVANIALMNRDFTKSSLSSKS